MTPFAGIRSRDMNRASLGWYICGTPYCSVVRIRVVQTVLADRCSADAGNEVRVIAAFDGSFPAYAGHALTPTAVKIVGRYNRHTDNLEDAYSSYADYLGLRKTEWVKPDLILNFFNKEVAPEFKKVVSYKDFVENYSKDSAEILGRLTIED